MRTGLELTLMKKRNEMNNNQKALMSRMALLIFLAVSLAGCDPMRRINMKNDSAGEAEIIWKIKEDSLHSSPFFISSDKEQKFVLSSTDPGNAIYMSAGIGTWTPKHVRNLVDDLESVVIRWDKGEIKLESEEDIFNFLLPRRKGVGKDKIEINVKDLVIR